MDKESKRRVKLTIIGILALVLLIVGISFAAFSTNFQGTKIQSMNTGCLKIDMTDDGSITNDNAMPESDESGLASTPYTYTITNSCTTDAFYETTINVMQGSTIENTEKIKVALEGDTYLAPTIESDLPVGELLDDEITGVLATYKLDEGFLTVGESKTFNLRTWIDYDVEDISGDLENKIIINSRANHGGAITYNKNTAGYDVLNKNTKLSAVDYGQIAPSETQASGYIEVKDESGVTYHFRGAPNNYLVFGNYNSVGSVNYTNSNNTQNTFNYTSSDSITWKVLGTNPDGSINIIKDDLIAVDTYTNSSTLINSFYANHLQDEENYIKEDQVFCKEEQTENNYLAKIRTEKHKPSPECNDNNNSGTKIGLPTVDDVMYAGGVNNIQNNDFYLYQDNKGFMTSSSSSNTNIYTSNYTKSIEEKEKSTTMAIRPVITLKANTKINGLGTEEEPFYISGQYGTSTENKEFEDEIAPVIDYARAEANWSNQNKRIEISARDNSTGSGLAGYIIKETNETPSLSDNNWEVSTSQKYQTVNTFDNGTYYVFAKDAKGNISEPKEVTVARIDKIDPTCTVRINPNGTRTEYKTLSIISEDTNINNKEYSWDHSDVIEDVIKVSKNGIYTAHLKDLAGNEGSCTAVVTNIPVVPLDKSGANAPVLSENMIAVYYDEDAEAWKKADSNNANSDYKWYDYDNKMWANSVTVSSENRNTYKNANPGTEIPMEDILTMQVWIPRYKYKIFNYNANGTTYVEEQQIDIAFESGTGTTGEVSCVDNIQGSDGDGTSETCRLKSNNQICTDATCNNKYYTHPAFTFGEDELEGIWVGKFELTGTISNITTKPDLQSIRSQKVSSFETNMMAMNDTNNIYGFSTNDDTHMMKNMEWGAVAYLTQSKYGMCDNGECSEININNSSGYYTGRSGGNVGGSTPINGTYPEQTSTTQYNTYGFYTYDGYLLNYNTNTKSDTKDINKIASTTKNIYGVYDMSGGAYEYVMGNIVSSDGTTMMSGYSASHNSGYTGMIYNSGNYTNYTGIAYPNNNYYDKYSFETSNTQKIRAKLGDAVKEVGTSSSRSWHNDYGYLADDYYPWFVRGGVFNGGSDAGVFFSSGDYGFAYSTNSARLVLALS